MIRIAIATTASALALGLALPAAAHDAPAAPQAAKAVETLAAAPADDAASSATDTPTMNFGTWGFTPSSLDKSIDPGNNFFDYVNEKWLEANPLPPEYSSFGSFNLLAEKSTSDVKALIDRITSADPSTLSPADKRIAAAYKAYDNTDAIDARGLAPAQPYLAKIKGADSLTDLATVWAMPGYSSPIGGYVGVDSKQPDRYTVSIGSGGLGLPDRDYYLDDSDKGRQIQAKYRDYLAFILGKAGYDDPQAMAQKVYDFEDQIAHQVTWDRATRRNRDLTYTALTPQQLVGLDPSFPMKTFLDASGFGDTDKFIVGDIPPTAAEAQKLGLTQATIDKIGGGTPAMLKLLESTPLDVLKAWTAERFIGGNAAVLPSDIDDAQFAFYGTFLNGTPQQRPRWKRAIGETDGLLGELVGREYVAKYFPPANKAAMEKLVGNLETALRQSIKESDRLSPSTKKEALAKLAAFHPKIGYRENLETYPGLDVSADTPIANRMAAAQWQNHHDLSKLGGPIDTTEWGMLPQTVNAYYNPSKNEVVFPAAILQPPFFALSHDIAINYGGIGAVIGHEMSHGFDDQGAKSDGTGLLRNWWTDADRKKFDAIGDRVVAQYDKFCPLDNGKTCVNGRLTLGENIGDLSGLALAYRAYKIATKGQQVPVIDGLTGDQRFFISWAQVWREKQREAAERQRLRTDVHSPAEVRVNGVVRNMDAWYKAFNVTPGDKLYVPPAKRIHIW